MDIDDHLGSVVLSMRKKVGTRLPRSGEEENMIPVLRDKGCFSVFQRQQCIGQV
ncbi:hypothetical protein C2845_PM02G20660 [Panicum miliaceum]|uniref:Uncharacterized protein n=1 Tax=Panicum miliaceum TaxID=4540 RepID=A0A3L6SJE2_PANMI|nr:hypothetical protein C2845_PM02G20660 [Panicum miliaceum]